MTKEVLVTLRGLQSDQDGENSGPIETISRGDYYQKNGKHYVIYEETVEGLEKSAKSRLKFDKDTVEVFRSGAVSTHMVFQEHKKNPIDYQTPFGQIRMEIVTRQIRLTRREDHIIVDVDYALEIDDAFLSDCRMVIDIRPAI